MKKHSHWPHMFLCIILCLVLHGLLEAGVRDDTSKYIADLQAQVDVLDARLDTLQNVSRPIPLEEWDR